MPRSEPARLREADARRPLRESDVIDARFRLVGRKRRALGAAWKALLAVLAAALVGFMIPPAWTFFESIGALFAGT